MKTMHLICNAHIDPVWMWEWEEGAAETLSTFRIAADFCEQYEEFVFNHNEMILYQWIEEYEPHLFKRIQKLVSEGKWNIMGGWYLQPDCNLPSGEAIVRQILTGRRFFEQKFQQKPTTAINFDPFGHSRGIVQILVKSGYDSYIFLRPGQIDCPLPANDFRWIGYDGSSVLAHRGYDGYNTLKGKALNKIEKYLEEYPNQELSAILWGIGNHGGGPSRADWEQIENWKKEQTDREVIHSSPEKYFNDLKRQEEIPKYAGSLNAWAVGCYTTQIRIKQQYRKFENQYFRAEKMLSAAVVQVGTIYPQKKLMEALKALLFVQFHDILPGTSVQSAEEASLRLIGYGREVLSKLEAKAFFAMAGGEAKAELGEIPVLVYNPHPFKVSGVFHCEFQLEDQNWSDQYMLPVLKKEGIDIPVQLEKEGSNIPIDWRKHIAFEADLEPYQMNRFNCYLKAGKRPEVKMVRNDGQDIEIKTKMLRIVINAETGLIDICQVNEIDYLKKGSFRILVMDDDDDAWGMNVSGFDKYCGEFVLMSKEEGTRYSGVRDNLLESVRIVEDGDVETVVEAMMYYRHSRLCMTYRIPRNGIHIQVHIRVLWSEPGKMLKLSIPTVMREGSYLGQTIYGREVLHQDGREVAAQKWTAYVSEKENMAVACINDGIYGSDCKDGEIRLSLLRSPGYSGHTIEDRMIMSQNRMSPRIDQGEREFDIWLMAGGTSEVLDHIDREALIRNEVPYILSCFPAGDREKTHTFVEVSAPEILLTACKRSEDGKYLMIRLFEAAGRDSSTMIRVKDYGIECICSFHAYEIKSFRLNRAERGIEEVDLMEIPLVQRV